jgi:hypothetical protein
MMSLRLSPSCLLLPAYCCCCGSGWLVALLVAGLLRPAAGCGWLQLPAAAWASFSSTALHLYEYMCIPVMFLLLHVLVKCGAHAPCALARGYRV